MPDFAANLSFLYTEYAFLDRFEKAAESGFKAVEFLFPYDWPAIEITARLRQYNLVPALFNLSPGNWSKDERGLACLPGRETEFKASVAQAIVYADRIGCKNLHALAGIPDTNIAVNQAAQTYLKNIEYAAGQAEKAGITLLIEPINQRDIPGYFLRSTKQACDLIDQLDVPNLKLQFDFYHCQITEGDITTLFESCLKYIGHIQIANPPLRSEPDIGEINYPHIFDLIDRSGYDGWVGCEYKPSKPVETSFDWARSYGILETVAINR